MNKQSLQVSRIHRVIMIILFITQLIMYAHFFVNFTNFYESNFTDYPSLVDQTRIETHYLWNAILYSLFFVQHIFLATVVFKKFGFKCHKYFVLYERYAYNIGSCLTLWLIFYLVQPSYHLVFEIPVVIHLPLNIIGTIIYIWSMVQLGYYIFCPFPLTDLFSNRPLTFTPFGTDGQKGVCDTGVYKLCRNPMMFSMILMNLFGSGLYTVDRLIFLAVILPLYTVGILNQENRMKAHFVDYEDYMKKVPARLIPYLW